jgi:hypothetical protein
MRNIVQTTSCTVAVDAEWKVELTTNGRVCKNHRVGLLQFCFLDNSGVYKTALVHTANKTTLHRQMEEFFRDDSITIVGVHVGSDLAKIGRDFNLSNVINGRRKESVINLGGYARDRDVVQNGKVSLDELCKAVLKQRIEKQTHLRFSDWNLLQMTQEQIEYAVRDALALLQIFDAIKSLPNLNSRLKPNEATVGKRVDIVPKSGNVACMATRAATGIISTAEPCDSPDGVTPTSVTPGKKHSVVVIEEIYSPSMKIPRYKKGGTSATIIDFKDRAVVVPVTMLKEHVASDSIRATPESGGREYPVENVLRVSAPASENPPSKPTSASANVSTPTVADNDLVDDAEMDDSYSIMEVEDFEDITTLDCENLRCAIFSASESEQGKPPMKCAYLDEAPSPSSIQDKFSSVLGDCFHLMDRPNIPVKHESKKAYKNALKNAFFIWNPETMNALVEQMKEGGMTDEEIESAKYFRPTLFHDCVERIVPAPKVLYWRVRAVFALYGPMIDSKTNAPLFNVRAWKRANNVLLEILAGFYSDPPGVPMYRKRVGEDGLVLKNKYGMDMIECMRGTNRTEAVHKGLVSTFGTWNMGVEMSSCVLAERRHRYNHRCSERRRLGFPRIGHYDTWLIDKLQNLVHKNHGRLLYPDWSNASDYKETDESFDTQAIHSQKLHSALKNRCNEMSREEKAKVKLTSDQTFICKMMGIELPFLPFATVEEYCAYNAFVVDGIPSDEDDAAAAWCKYVDGVNIFPKLPVHPRSYRDRWERNQRVKDAVKRAKAGSDKLNELNKVLVPALDERQNVAQQHAAPAQTLPALTPQALSDEPYVVTARTSIGNLPCNSCVQTNRSGRGKDVKARSGRRCAICIKKGSMLTASICAGRGRQYLCEYFCRICVNKNCPFDQTCKGRGNSKNCEYFCSKCVQTKNGNASLCRGRGNPDLCLYIK